MSSVKEFYDQLQFPGTYTMAGLDYHSPKIRNPYLKTIDHHLGDGISVLDAGCGTGLISNLFARKYPSSQFVGIDFAHSVNYAIQFALTHNISNVEFRQSDLLSMTPSQYDVVICQGVLHHIPDYERAADNLTVSVRPGGKLILGVYHPWGKLVKKLFNIDYKNDILYQDQECHPYETAFTISQVKKLFPNLKLLSGYLDTINTTVGLKAITNYRNGGLTIYILEKPL